MVGQWSRTSPHRFAFTVELFPFFTPKHASWAGTKKALRPLMTPAEVEARQSLSEGHRRMPRNEQKYTAIVTPK
jgi:hypothetical protein